MKFTPQKDWTGSNWLTSLFLGDRAIVSVTDVGTAFSKTPEPAADLAASTFQPQEGQQEQSTEEASCP